MVRTPAKYVWHFLLPLNAGSNQIIWYVQLNEFLSSIYGHKYIYV
jgi:hypothetical protein